MPELNRPLEAIKPDFLKFIDLILEYRCNSLGTEGIIVIPLKEPRLKVSKLNHHVYLLLKVGVLRNFENADYEFLEIKSKKSNGQTNKIIFKEGRKKFLALSTDTKEKIKKYRDGLLVPPSVSRNGENKIPINISLSDNGIYRNRDGRFVNYPISGRRAKLVECLKDNKKDAAVLLEVFVFSSIQLLSKEIKNINTLFKKNLRVEDDLIIHIETGGYALNKTKYLIKFD